MTQYSQGITHYSYRWYLRLLYGFSRYFATSLFSYLKRQINVSWTFRLSDYERDHYKKLICLDDLLDRFPEKINFGFYQITIELRWLLHLKFSMEGQTILAKLARQRLFQIYPNTGHPLGFSQTCTCLGIELMYSIIYGIFEELSGIDMILSYS